MTKNQRPKTNGLWQSSAANEVLLERALMLKNIRAFFDVRGIIEVETPLASHYCTTDPQLDSFRSNFREQSCYLNTSPEYAMKRLLAGWQRPIYQICKAFRDDEQGANHNPEFTMLEWYRPDFDMFQLMDELAELVLMAASFELDGEADDKWNEPVQRYSYLQAFEKFVGINPHVATSTECMAVAGEKNIEIPQGLTVNDPLDEWLDWLLIQLVFPEFSKHGFTFLYDYPASQSSLARVEQSSQSWSVAKRFELFFGEIELANGFHELTDADEQLRRFEKENEMRRQQGKAVSSIDMNLIAALHAGLPDCSGVALGLDRLLMARLGSFDIKDVLSFSWDKA